MGLRSTPSERLRQWVGNVIVGWTLVASLAALLGGAYYNKTGDRWILYGVIGGAGVGCIFLLGVAGVVGIATRRRRTRAAVTMPHQKRETREGIFMKR
jgi:hypothetical protein